jgi:hypothetical protein
MQDHTFYEQLLELHSPWQVLDVSIDQSSKRLDIHLGFSGIINKGLLDLTRVKVMFGISGQHICPRCQSELPKNDEFKTIIVRHLPIAGFATYLHVPAPGSVQSSKPECACMQSWVAEGTGCTVAMRNHIVALLQAVKSTNSVLQLAGITDEELQNIIASTKTLSAGITNAKAALPRADSTDSSNILPLDHPNWQLLINGKLPIQTVSVALRMLLQHVRASYNKTPGRTAGITGAKLLRQFFIRNKKSLNREINQINNYRPGRGVETANNRNSLPGTDNLPEESALVWQRIVNGDQHLNTNMVGLQMILVRVRKSIQQDSSAVNRQACIGNIYQFFIKHKERLSQEITQLTDNTATSVDTLNAAIPAAGPSLPDERDVIWDRLINGKIELQSNAVSLKLLLGRIRQNISTNATEAQRISGAQILRNYFLRNQQRHSDDIRLLINQKK